jgi:sugar/nucleoside kinase (ribokinase family)
MRPQMTLQHARHLHFAGMQADIDGLCILKTLAAYQSARARGLDVSIGLGGLLVP